MLSKRAIEQLRTTDKQAPDPFQSETLMTKGLALANFPGSGGFSPVIRSRFAKSYSEKAVASARAAVFSFLKLTGSVRHKLAGEGYGKLTRNTIICPRWKVFLLIDSV
jgi:hypothetical protein